MVGLAALPVCADDSFSLSDGLGELRARASRLQDELEADGWAIHGQQTFIYQGHPGFRSPYSGDASLTKSGKWRETWSMGAMVGRKLWSGGEVYFNPEIDQGFGLSNSLGVAGFPNNEAFRVGTESPRLNYPRLFLRQTIGLGGPQELLEADTAQFAGNVDVHRLTLTFGKLSVWDLFDDNKYSHDPRTQFMNWALVGNGAIDFAADAKGYTTGFAADYNRADWAARLGVFQVAKAPNSKPLDDHILDGWQVLGELEQRFTLFDRPGRLRQIGMIDRTRAISYGSFASLAPINATDDDLGPLRRYRLGYGLGLNLEQELDHDVGLFARLSWNPGKTQEYMFTEIDRAVSAGLSIKGTRWSRPNDIVGVAGLMNGLSDSHKAFYANGNIGFIVGDGRLNYGLEQIIETYYDLQLTKGVNFALDYQFVNNPGYNADRGPVSIFSVRLHGEF